MVCDNNNNNKKKNKKSGQNNMFIIYPTIWTKNERKQTRCLFKFVRQLITT